MKSVAEVKTLPTRKLESQEATLELEGEIRLRAYELWEQRNRGDGHDMQDWLDAETELRSKTLAA